MIDKSELLGNDYRLFQQTPVWNLAKAVQDENLKEIKRIIVNEKVDINYSEPKYGNTLLILTVENQHYRSCKTLLELGADPNKHNNYNGSSAMIESAGIENYNEDNTRFLKLLLAYGGNVNDEEIGKRQEGNSTRRTPLLLACSDVNQFVSPINKVKILVEAGANVNYKNEYNAFPLKEALMHDHYDVVLYLLQKGADYSLMLFDRAQFSNDGKKIYTVDLLREKIFPLDSKKYQQKMEVVAFLKQKDIDYRKIPIPDFVIEKAKKMYPNSWQEYLDKY
ncbi:Ankyrin repeats (3 copies) [compost metagenome]